MLKISTHINITTIYTWIFLSSLKGQWGLSHWGSASACCISFFLLWFFLQLIIVFVVAFHVLKKICGVAAVANRLLADIAVRRVFIYSCEIAPHDAPLSRSLTLSHHSMYTGAALAAGCCYLVVVVVVVQTGGVSVLFRSVNMDLLIPKSSWLQDSKVWVACKQSFTSI